MAKNHLSSSGEGGRRPCQCPPHPVEPHHPAQVAQYQRVPQRIARPQKRRHLPPCIEDFDPFKPAGDGPCIGLAPEPGAFLFEISHGGIDLFPDPRHRREHMRRDFLEVLEDRLGALGEIDRRTRRQRQEDRGVAFEDVAQRQETELLVGRLRRQVEKLARRRRDDIGLGDHRPFRLAGGAGGVDQQRHVIGAAPADRIAEHVRMGGQRLVAERVEIVETHHLRVIERVKPLVVGDDDLFDQRHLVADQEELVELLLVLRHQKAALAVLQQIGELGSAVGGVDPRADAAHALDTHVEIGPFPEILGQHRHGVAARQPQRVQRRADALGALPVIRPRIALPDAEVFLAVRGALAQLFAALRKQLRDRVAAVDQRRQRHQVGVDRHTIHQAAPGPQGLCHLHRAHLQVLRRFQRRSSRAPSSCTPR